MSDSYIEVDGDRVVAYVGPDAIKVAQAIVLKHAIRGWRRFRMLPTRGITVKRIMSMAFEITGERFKKNDDGYEAAEVAIDAWLTNARQQIEVRS